MTPDPVYDEAAAWLARAQDEAMDWDSFTLWLEADARHRAAYDQLALLNSALGRHSGPLLREVVNAEHSPALRQHEARWPRTAALGAGALVAGLGALFWLAPRQVPVSVQEYQSGPTQSAWIALGDAGKVLLAPSSHLTVKGLNLSLQGSALFDVPHRANRALKISAGEFEITDVGTRFTIENDPEAVIVELADGSLIVGSDHLAEPVSLSAGQGLIADPKKGTVRLTRISPQLVGSWRTGKLEFDNAPLVLVARQISRYSGKQVTVDPKIADQPFSGVIAVNHGEAPEQSLAQILSLEIKRVDGDVRLEPRRK